MSGCGDKCEPGTSIHVAKESTIGHVEKQAALGFTSGGDKYDAFRPGYTDESVDVIVSEVVSVIREAHQDTLKYGVLELGAGTGKMTEKLSKKLPGEVKYLATDVSENFLDVLKGKGLNVDLSLASADNIPVEDKSVGSVVCAQCFHWFYGQKNLESIHRVLVRGGKLILIWYKGDFDEELKAKLTEMRQHISEKIGSLNHDISSMEWQKDINVSPLFKLKWYKSLPGIGFQGNIETVMAGVETSSIYKCLPPEEREGYMSQLRDTIIRQAGLDLNDIKVPYKTELYLYEAQ